MLWALLGGLMVAANPAVARAASGRQETGGDSFNIWLLILPIATAALIVERTIELVWNFIEWLALNFSSAKPASLKSPAYVQFKSGASLLLGVIIGLLAAKLLGLHLLDYLRPLMPGLLDNVPPTWDILIAGLVVGALSKPVHESLGILTELKNWLGGSAIRQRAAAGSESRPAIAPVISIARASRDDRSPDQASTTASRIWRNDGIPCRGSGGK